MKAIVFSNSPWSMTGYGQQTALLLPFLAERYGVENVAVAANHGLQGCAQRWNGIRIYPGGNTPYSDDVGPIHAMHFFDDEPGLVIILFDVYVLQNPAWAELNVAAWTPVDHQPCPPLVKEFFTRTGAAPIAMSRFGHKQLRDVDLDPYYIPHAVDCRTYHPIEGARPNFDLPDDAFIVGMVANNKGTAPSRKAFPEMFTAFGTFARAHRDAILYVHGDQFGFRDGLDLQKLAELADIPEGQIRFADPYELIVGTPAATMAALYSSFDVLASPSFGEGFGIPVIEAQACGTPVIVNDFSAQPELVGAGWTVEGQPFADMNQTSWFQIPSVDSIVDRLERCYSRTAPEIATDMKAARAKAIQYDVTRVWRNNWSGTLAAIEHRLPSVSPITE